MKILIFDTETTGLPKNRKSLVTDTEEWPHIVQFSYIIYDMFTNKLEKVIDYIIKLPVEIDIPEESFKIHGITKEISNEQGIVINKVIDQFMLDLSKCNLLVAHNLEFDLNMVIVELIRMNRYAELIGDDIAFNLNSSNYEQLMNIEKYCTMTETEKRCNIKAVSKNGKEYSKYPTLGELHYYLFRSYPKNLHNSLNDILICLRCYYKLITKKDIYLENNEIKQLLELLVN